MTCTYFLWIVFCGLKIDRVKNLLCFIFTNIRCWGNTVSLSYHPAATSPWIYQHIKSLWTIGPGAQAITSSACHRRGRVCVLSSSEIHKETAKALSGLRLHSCNLEGVKPQFIGLFSHLTKNNWNTVVFTLHDRNSLIFSYSLHYSSSI